MIIFLSILGVILLIIAWLLFGPVTILLDTRQQLYYVKIPVLFKSQLIINEQGKKLRISVFFIPFTVNMDKKSPKRDQAVSDEIKPKKKAKGWRKIRWNRNFFKQASMIWKFTKDILLTFRIKQASINFDTGDFVLNSQLIPALLLVSRKNISLSVNYTAQNSLLLIMQNRLYRIVWRAAIFYYRFRKL